MQANQTVPVAGDIDAFKRAAARFASGVTVVTTLHGGEVYGITVSAFASFSIDPLQILVSIWRGSRLHAMIGDSGVFAVSILEESQRAVSEYFATPGRTPSRDGFETVSSHRCVTGAPIIDGCLAYFDCRVGASLPGGDHVLFIGEVLDAGSRDGTPLLYFSRDYRGLRELAQVSAAG